MGAFYQVFYDLHQSLKHRRMECISKHAPAYFIFGVPLRNLADKLFTVMCQYFYRLVNRIVILRCHPANLNEEKLIPACVMYFPIFFAREYEKSISGGMEGYPLSSIQSVKKLITTHVGACGSEPAQVYSPNSLLRRNDSSHSLFLIC